MHSASLNTTSTRQRSGGLSAQWSAKRGGHQLAAGASYDHNTVSFAQFEQDAGFSAQREVRANPDAAREPASAVVGATRALGLYLADTWSVGGATHVTASARLNHARVGNTRTNDNGRRAPETFTYKKLNPAFGVARDIDGVAGLTLFANLARSNRAPTVIELGCADPLQPCRLPVGSQSAVSNLESRNAAQS